ncbi:MAG: hypothetical protein MUQ10_11195 [Anaerolineae bacterium]|nr:hypothetical protein [Anaerolineae bacterium]
MSGFADWIAREIKRWGMTKDKRILPLVLCVILLVLVGGSYLILVSRTAEKGRDIQWLEDELSDVRAGNEHLEVQLATEGSVRGLLQRAREQNFILADGVEFLTVPEQ